jgi:hypothetical protein
VNDGNHIRTKEKAESKQNKAINAKWTLKETALA